MMKRYCQAGSRATLALSSPNPMAFGSAKTIVGLPGSKRADPSLSIRYYRQSDDLELLRDMFVESNLHWGELSFSEFV